MSIEGSSKLSVNEHKRVSVQHQWIKLICPNMKVPVRVAPSVKSEIKTYLSSGSVAEVGSDTESDVRFFRLLNNMGYISKRTKGLQIKIVHPIWLQVLCESPTGMVRVRSSPSNSGDIISYIKHNEVLRFYPVKVNGYLSLAGICGFINPNTRGVILSEVLSPVIEQTVAQINKYSIKCGCFLELKSWNKLPLFRHPFYSNWLRLPPTSDSINNAVFLLQAAYHDRYGQSRPTLPDSGKSKLSTYKHDNGEFLFLPPSKENSAIMSQIKNSKEATNQNNDDGISNKEISSSIGTSAGLRWSSAVRKYESDYHVNPEKFEYLRAQVQRTKSLTIFLSSPFDGCHLERENFMTKFYPSLLQICENKGIFLSVVDMRWGITQDLVDFSRTIHTCLNSIDQSHIFLGYFGARYGSSNLCTDPGSDGKTWIDKDLEYCTQFPAFDHMKVYKDRSITEMEFLHTFMHEKFYEMPNKPISFVFFRDPEYDRKLIDIARSKMLECPTDKSLQAEYDRMVKFYSVERGSTEAFESMKEKVRDISRLNPDYVSIFENYSDPELGSRLMYSCCNSLLKQLMGYLPAPLESDLEYQLHLSFAISRLRFYVTSDESVDEKIEKFVSPQSFNIDEHEAPLVITGESGGGKSSLLADVLMNKQPLVKKIFHFVGCTRDSTNFLGMLKRIYDESIGFLKPYLNLFQTSSLVGFNELDPDEVLSTICNIYRNGNQYYAPSFVVIIDALNQLADVNYFDDHKFVVSDLKWLPTVFPKKIRFIVSTLSGRVLESLQNRSADLKGENSNYMFINPLTEIVRKKSAMNFLEKFYKSANSDYIDQLCSAQQCSNPFYLCLALNFLVRNASYKYLKDNKCNEILQCPDILTLVQFMMNKGINELCQSSDVFNHDTFLFILSVVYCSRIGLTQFEIIELINFQIANSATETDTSSQQNNNPDGRSSATTTQAFTSGNDDLNPNLLDVAIHSAANVSQKRTVILKPLSPPVLITVEQQLSMFITPQNGFYNFTHDFVRQATEKLCFFNENSTSAFSFSMTEFSSIPPTNTIYSEIVDNSYLRSDRFQAQIRSFHKTLAEYFEQKSFSDIEDGAIGRYRDYGEEMRYHRKLAGIRPNIVVAVRIRPLLWQTQTTASANVPSPSDIPHDSSNMVESRSLQSCAVADGNSLTICEWQQPTGTPFNTNTSEVARSDFRGEFEVSAKAKILSMSSFTFDYVFDSVDNTKRRYASQEKVFNSLRDQCISDAVEGRNVCVMAYGQSGSGKSYTMYGSDESKGLIPRIVEDLIGALNEKKRDSFSKWTWSASCTMVEIYLNRAYDLLRGYSIDKVGVKLTDMTEKSKTLVTVACTRVKDLELTLDLCSSVSEPATCDADSKTSKVEATKRMVKSKKKQEALKQRQTDALPTQWDGAIQVNLATIEDVNNCLTAGNATRVVHANGIHDASSRSHCIFTIYLQQSQKNGTERVTVKNKIHLVDLAGSERIKKTGSVRLNETKAINSSLSALNECIRMLSDPKSTFIPYRASTLTWFLQDSLGGDSKVIFIATISPAPSDRIESTRTLEFATFARNMSSMKDQVKLKAVLEGKSGGVEDVGCKTTFQCSICLERQPLSNCMRMSCCDVKFSDKLCRQCLDVISVDFDSVSVGRCPLCKMFYTMKDGTPVYSVVHAQCCMCCQPKEIVDTERGLCNGCLLGSKFQFRYECSRCHNLQRIPFPLWIGQPAADQFTGEGWWYCHVGCNTHTGWRLSREDVDNVPLAFCFAEWDARDQWLEEIRTQRKEHREDTTM